MAGAGRPVVNTTGECEACVAVVKVVVRAASSRICAARADMITIRSVAVHCILLKGLPWWAGPQQRCCAHTVRHTRARHI